MTMQRRPNQALISIRQEIRAIDLVDGVDPTEYDVVDISLQDAGQTEHSGHSLLRGTLA